MINSYLFQLFNHVKETRTVDLMLFSLLIYFSNFAPNSKQLADEKDYHH